TFAEPRILVSPYLALYRVRGDAALQSQPVPGTFQDNAAQNLRSFGQERYKEDVGVRADIGDGFAGARIDWCQLDMNTSHTGVLGADWGNLLQGDTVRAKVTMDELRLGLCESLGTLRTSWRDQPLTFRFAGGGVVAHRDFDVRGRTDDGTRTQNVEIEGDLVYVAARARATWRDFAVDAEYAICPELELRGDFDGVLHDLELRASWTMPLHDVTFFAGWRLSTLQGKGEANNLAYDADLTVDGFQLGLSVTF
ncbi:MAG: hypothetical protein JNK15_00715, partial [Planctomycetes bacterium]|nr:hypothetical protein [Planctomycetota bacterium]